MCLSTSKERLHFLDTSPDGFYNSSNCWYIGFILAGSLWFGECQEDIKLTSSIFHAWRNLQCRYLLLTVTLQLNTLDLSELHY